MFEFLCSDLNFYYRPSFSQFSQSIADSPRLSLKHSFFFSIIFNIPRFFELRTVMNAKNTTIFNETIEENVTSEVLMPEVEPTEIRKDSAYSRDYVLIANSVALGFIPIIALIVLNSFIFRTINKARPQ